jgi:hypothetical protein
VPTCREFNGGGVYFSATRWNRRRLNDPTDIVGTQPLLLTVTEAARLLWIGRSLAYRLAHRYEASGVWRVYAWSGSDGACGCRMVR